MRQIHKSQEPASLTNWKALQRNTPNFYYNYLQNPAKRELHQVLLQEQGYLCCYCEMRVSQQNSHIEHLKPQSECSSEETVEYINLLACCQGEGEVSRKPEHCGQRRGKSPLNSNSHQA
ncbi:retron system putative HNH endonuclease [Leptothermofonsia sp. ETS-13]|uniref:retron system putative HNH endonuclease n=1 Tax=Leptothermofonsia sp. ETS-13 TaxID=3035696 RepID=UPI003BA3A10A